MRMTTSGVCAALLALSPGCAPRKAVIDTGELPQDQWSRGVYEYGQACAGCHGEELEGSESGPPLTGAASLPAEPHGDRKQRLDNAAALFAFVKAEMPPLEPGSLTDDQYWTVLVYVLKTRGVKLPEELGRDNAAGVKLR